MALKLECTLAVVWTAADALTTRSAWCRVKGFPWWPAQQLLLSRSNAQECQRQLISAVESVRPGGASSANGDLLDGAGAPENPSNSIVQVSKAVPTSLSAAQARSAPESATETVSKSGAVSLADMAIAPASSIEDIDADLANAAISRSAGETSLVSRAHKRRASDPSSLRQRELALLQTWDPLPRSSQKRAGHSDVTAPSARTDGTEAASRPDRRLSRSLVAAAVADPSTHATIQAGTSALLSKAAPRSPEPGSHQKGQRRALSVDSADSHCEVGMPGTSASPIDSSDNSLIAKRAKESARRERDKIKRQKDRDRQAKRAEDRRAAAVAPPGMGSLTANSGSATFRFLGDDSSVWAKVTDAPLLDAHTFHATILRATALPADLVEVRGDDLLARHTLANQPRLSILLQRLSAAASAAPLLRGHAASTLHLRRAALPQWRWVPPEWQRAHVPSAQYAAAMDAAASYVTTAADAHSTVGAVWRASAARDTLRTVPFLLPLDARQAAALACAMVGLPLQTLQVKILNAPVLTASVVSDLIRTSDVGACVGPLLAVEEGNGEAIASGPLLRPSAATLVSLLADCGSLTPATTAGPQSGPGVSWLLGTPSSTSASSSAVVDRSRAVGAATVAAFANSALGGDTAAFADASLAPGNVANHRSRRPSSRPASALDSDGVDDSIAGAATGVIKGPPRAPKPIGGGNSTGPLHPTAWVGRWVAWRDFSYGSAAAAVTLPSRSSSVAKAPDHPPQSTHLRRVVEYSNRLLSHAEMRLLHLGDPGGIDGCSGVPASWFEDAHVILGSALCPEEGGGLEQRRANSSETAYVLAVEQSLLHCRVKSETNPSQLCASLPSAYGRWVGGWVARFDSATGLHLIVYDTPTSTALSDSAISILDGTLFAAEAGVGMDRATNFVSDTEAPAWPGTILREWVRIDDLPVVLLPIESRLVRLPPPAPLATPRVLRGRAIDSAADKFIEQFISPASLSAGAQGASQSVSPAALCSICFHTGSILDPLLLCATLSCKHACHVSCFDPFRAAESSLVAQREYGSATAASSIRASEPSAQVLELLPRSTRDDIFGWAVQQRESRTRFSAPRRAGPAEFRTTWCCHLCRSCDSCGSAHPGGPFAQNASSLATRVLDAVIDGYISSAHPRPPHSRPTSCESVDSTGVTKRALLPLWARGGVCGPADACASDTSPCMKAIDMTIAAHSEPEPPAATKQAGIAAMSTTVYDDYPIESAPCAASSLTRPAVNPALASAIRRYGYGPPLHGRSLQPKGWASPDLSVSDRLQWGLHSFTPIPGTFQYNARRANALASAASMSPAGPVVTGIVTQASDAPGAHAVVLPSDPVEQLLCAYCVNRISDGCFCPVCHGVYTDGDGQMVQVCGCGWVGEGWCVCVCVCVWVQRHHPLKHGSCQLACHHNSPPLAATLQAW